MTRQVIFPVTRIHEPMRVEVEVANGVVVDAWISSELFRGFEPMMLGRDPRDASLFTQRICGICTTAHAVGASFAQQQAFGVAPTPNGQHLINLISAADFLQNHLRHFYGLVLFDYVKGFPMPPFQPPATVDYRLPPKVNADILEHYKLAMRTAASAHEMLAIFGAKAPMQQTIVPTGVTEQASSERIMAYTAILREIREVVEKVYIPDVLTIAEYYKDYYAIGGGYGNLLSYGLYPEPVTGARAFPAGVILRKGAAVPVDEGAIAEGVRHSWYRDTQESRRPAEGVTIPDRDKADAYTWTKAPRYQGAPFEGGPLARGWMSGDWRRGVSVMDRIIARAREALKICRLAEGWLGQLVPGAPTLRPYTPPPQGAGVGLTDAMRGALGHWMSYQNGRVTQYQVVTPTTWNFSPRDAAGQRGPAEEALVGTPVADPSNLVEVGRVVRSFDPCLTCAVHVVNRPGAAPYIV